MRGCKFAVMHGRTCMTTKLPSGGLLQWHSEIIDCHTAPATGFAVTAHKAVVSKDKGQPGLPTLHAQQSTPQWHSIVEQNWPFR